MYKSLMLYPSQLQAKAELTEILEHSMVCVLQGMSGSGKSTVGEQVIADYFAINGRTIEEDRVSFEVDRLIRLMVNRARVIVLSPVGSNPSFLSGHLRTIPPVVKMRCLAPNEVESWMDTVEPALTEEERALVRTYSLGVPLHIERFCRRRPVMHSSVFSQCCVHLQQIVNKCCLSGKNRNGELA